MESYRKLLKWQFEHNTLPIDLIRIFLGVALFVRGVLFLIDPSELNEFVEQRDGLAWAAHYITWAHILGGAMLTTGLLTRVAALIQLPVLMGALALVHLREGLFSPTQSVELTGLVLFLLAVALVFGAGKLSLDYKLYGRRVTDGGPILPATA